MSNTYSQYSSLVVDFHDFKILDLDTMVWLPVACSYPKCRGGIHAVVETSRGWLLSGMGPLLAFGSAGCVASCTLLLFCCRVRVCCIRVFFFLVFVVFVVGMTVVMDFHDLVSV